jgi:hypothetical protein
MKRRHLSRSWKLKRWGWTCGNMHAFLTNLSEGQSPTLTHQEAFVHCQYYMFLSLCWVLKDLCYSLVQSVLRFWFLYWNTCSYSLEFWRTTTQCDWDNLKLTNCTFLYLHPHNSSTSQCISKLTFDIFSASFHLSKQIAVHTSLPHTNCACHASCTKDTLFKNV